MRALVLGVLTASVLCLCSGCPLTDQDIATEQEVSEQRDQEHLLIEPVAGYQPGAGGISTVLGADETLYLAAVNHTTLFLYTVTDNEVVKERVAYDALSPALAIDDDGCLHIAYRDTHLKALAHAWRCEEDWSIEVVDDTADAGGFASIALDQAGAVHVSYHRTKGGLRYATNASGEWVIEEVESSAYDVGLFTSLQLDDAGAAHISYFALAQEGLHYATNADGDWQTSVVDAGFLRGAFSSIGLDTTGLVHITYLDFPGMCLRHAWGGGQTWESEEVDISRQASLMGAFTDLKIDDEDVLHVAYYGFSGPCYAEKRDGRWEMVRVDHVIPMGLYPQLELADDGAALVSYISFPYQRLIVASNREPGRGAGPFWQRAIQEPPGYVESHDGVGIFVEQSGKAHICYAGTKPNGIFYATDSTGLWTTSVVDERHYAGSDCNLVVDAAGAAHLFYQARTYLWHTTNASGAWVIDPLDELGDTRQADAVTIDQQGHIWLAYISDEDLYLANNASGQWERELVVRDESRSPRLVLDVQGFRHILFVHKGNLKYATDASGAWVIQTLDRDALIIDDLDLAIDHAGVAHIAYVYTWYDKATENVRYMVNRIGLWEREDIVSDINWWPGDNIVIRLDEQDDPQVLYTTYKLDHRELLLWERSDGTWQSTLLLSGAIDYLKLGRPGDDFLRFAISEGSELLYAVRE